jgi:ABC-2 type transport system permease protein
MRAALVIAGKELRQRLRDRTAFVLAFVAPTALAAIVSAVFGTGFGPDADFAMSFAVVDLDRSDISKAFTDQVLKSEQLRDQVMTLPVKTEKEARKLVDENKASAAYVIPKGFEKRVSAGGKAAITVINDVTDAIQGDIATAIASAYTSQVNASRLAVFTTIRASGGDLSNVAALGAEAAREQMPVQLVDAQLATREVNGAQYFGPGMAMFFLFFTVGTAARGLLAEKQQGTLPRILAAPSPRWSVIFGKASAAFVLGVVSMTTVFLTMRIFFGVHWGDPIAIAALTVLTVLALLALVAVVQTLAKNEAQAGSYGSIIGAALGLLGGNFFPLFQMPKFVQTVSALTPNGWALRGFTDIAYDGATAADLLPNFAAIAAFAAICGGVAVYRARRITVA